MASVSDWIASGKTVLLDGGMGSQLIARGLKGGEHWNLDRPDVVLAIHRDYLAAGAQILLTNTLNANRLNLGRHGEGDKVEAYNRAGAELALRAAAGAALVAGDMGTTGQFLEPLGEGTSEEFLEVFREQARALTDAGVDLLLIETMTDIPETVLAIQACREVSSLPVAASMTFDPAAGGYRTMMGKTPAQCARALDEAGAHLIGTNCGTIAPAQMAVIVAEMRAATEKPLLCEANAGAPEMVGGQVRYAQSLEDWLAGMQQCRAAGAQLVGGCCGTTPEHIHLLAQSLGL